MTSLIASQRVNRGRHTLLPTVVFSDCVLLATFILSVMTSAFVAVFSVKLATSGPTKLFLFSLLVRPDFGRSAVLMFGIIKFPH